MVMKEGQILEIGGYKELIDKNGAFARMYVPAGFRIGSLG